MKKQQVYSIILAALLLTGITACHPSAPGKQSTQARFDSCNNYIISHKINLSEHLDTVIQLCKEIQSMPPQDLTKEQQKWQVQHYASLTSCYLLKGDTEQMLNNNIEGEKQAERIGDPVLISNFSVQLGAIYSSYRMQKQADYYLDKAIRIIPKVQSKRQIISTYSTKAGALMNNGKATEGLIYVNKVDSMFQADKDLEKSIPIEFQYIHNYVKGWVYANIPDSATSCIRTLEALHRQYAAQKEVVAGYPVICFNLGKAYDTLGEHKKAETLYDEAQQIINAHDNNVTYYEAALFLIERHLEQQDTDRAIQLLPHWHRLNKSFFTTTMANLLTAYNVEYQSNEKDRQVENLQWEVKTRNLQITIYIMLIIVLTGALIAGLLWWRKRKQQLRQLFEMLLRRHLEWKNLNIQLIENYNHLLMIETITSKDANGERPLVQENPEQHPHEDPAYYETLHNIYSRTLYLMEKEKPFLNPKLTIEELAHMATTNRTHLSSAINRITHSNFNLWLAEYRVNYLIELVYDKGYENKSIDELYTMAGFPSRSSFYRQFKQVTGLTPNQFVKHVK